MAEGARDDTAAADATDAPAGSAEPLSPPVDAAVPPSADEIAPDATAEPDLGRRRFFRQLASDVFQATATVVGAANALQQTSIQAASAILDPDVGRGIARGDRDGRRTRRHGRAASGRRSGSTATG